MVGGALRWGRLEGEVWWGEGQEVTGDFAEM